jgi:hypothetical protein
MHDIVQVTGFYKNTPEIVFVSKIGDIGDIVGERVAGTVIVRVATSVFGEKGVSLRHVCAVTRHFPPHYLFCVEPEPDAWDRIANIDKSELIDSLDNELKKEVGYRVMRRDALILKPDVQFMRQGWRDILYKEKMQPGMCEAQVKLPVIYDEDIPKQEFLLAAGT